MTRRGESKRNAVMLSTFATLSVNSAKHLEAHGDRPFAAAQGDTVRQLRLMRIGRPKGRPYYATASQAGACMVAKERFFPFTLIFHALCHSPTVIHAPVAHQGLWK